MGALVGPATGLSNSSGMEVFYLDPAGRLWPVTRENAQIESAAFITTLGIGIAYFTGADCTGTAYTDPVSPRFVFRVSGDSTYYVRPDTLQSQAFPGVNSYRSGASGTCANLSISITITGIALADATPSPALTLPSVSFVPPVHLAQ